MTTTATSEVILGQRALACVEALLPLEQQLLASVIERTLAENGIIIPIEELRLTLQNLIQDNILGVYNGRYFITEYGNDVYNSQEDVIAIS